MNWDDKDAKTTTFDEWNSCKRKVAYGHRQTAKRAAVAMKAKGILNLKAYKCRHCAGFHIGRPPGIWPFLWRLLPKRVVKIHVGFLLGYLVRSDAGNHWVSFTRSRKAER